MLKAGEVLGSIVSLFCLVVGGFVIVISDIDDIFFKSACIIDFTCTDEIKNGILRITTVLAMSLLIPTSLHILTNINNIRKNSSNIENDVSIILENIHNSISVIDNDKFEYFYASALRGIENAAYEQTVIRATSSFTPPDTEMREKYFDGLAKIITRKSSPNYQVLMAKGNNSKWDEECLKELKIRKTYMDKHAEANGRPWHYDQDFSARRSRYHARMDFLIIKDTVFLNVSTSVKNSGDRGYIYIKDNEVADIFRRWFDTIWKDNRLSSKIDLTERGFEFERSRTG
ncbi:hypothetical protein P7L70_11910 [Tistrella mobilis]|uniref:hypothetical protein n=1 Tax=Tistrella mobilis TaxID=171437 RepID=UPI003557EB69